MSMKRLGRGLSDIIDSAPSGSAPSGASNFVMLRMEQIRPGRFQPRAAIHDAALEELKASIQRSGVIEPVIVRPVAHGTYELVAGERRLKASQAVGLKEIPAIMKTLTDREALEFSLVENIQRENLNPLEEDKGYQRLLVEFGYTQEAIAAAVGKDRATVANALRVLTLPELIQQGLRDSVITMGHAKALLGVADRAKQRELYRRAVSGKWSVRETEAFAGAARPAKRRRAIVEDPQLKLLEDELRRLFGTKVRLVARKSGGRIIIEYFTNDDLERILSTLRGTA